MVLLPLSPYLFCPQFLFHPLIPSPSPTEWALFFRTSFLFPLISHSLSAKCSSLSFLLCRFSPYGEHADFSQHNFFPSPRLALFMLYFSLPPSPPNFSFILALVCCPLFVSVYQQPYIPPFFVRVIPVMLCNGITFFFLTSALLGKARTFRWFALFRALLPLSLWPFVP